MSTTAAAAAGALGGGGAQTRDVSRVGEEDRENSTHYTAHIYISIDRGGSAGSTRASP